MGRALWGWVLQVGYNYTSWRNSVFAPTNRNGAQFMTARAYTDVFDRLGVYLAPNYDFAAAKLLSAEYGVRLKSPCDCWAADFGITQSYNPNELQYPFQLTLRGLGSASQSSLGRYPSSPATSHDDRPP